MPYDNTSEDDDIIECTVVNGTMVVVKISPM